MSSYPRVFSAIYSFVAIGAFVVAISCFRRDDWFLGVINLVFGFLALALAIRRALQ